MKVSRHSDYQLPETLRQKLLGFRRRLWTLKLIEAAAAAVIAILVGFLLTYLLDRLHDTSAWVRMILLIAAASGSLAIPWSIQRWVIRRRRLDQLARLLSQTRPHTGDQLLGVIELADDSLDGSSSERARSPQLVQAAIGQVAENLADQNLDSAIPHPRHLQRGLTAGFLGLVTVVLAVFTMAATTNAWARFLAPWKQTPRYTFASVNELPAQIVVPQDEPFEFTVALSGSSRWNPATATVGLTGQPLRSAPLSEDRYSFELPGQLSDDFLQIRVGDFRGETIVQPKQRPELHRLLAIIDLPEYLGREQSLSKEVRGSTLSVLRGSRTRLTAHASRELSHATVNEQIRPTSERQFATPTYRVDQATALRLQWRDRYGLSGREPFVLNLEPLEDAPPTVTPDGLPRRKVLLDSEVINFHVLTSDDFGIKHVGIEWRAIDEQNPNPAHGESIIGAGGSTVESLELAATFCAAQQNISSPLISVRVFAEDFLPGRERSYSNESVFDVLSADQHAIWVSSELVRWQRSSLDARDRELQLHETNKSLRELSDDQLLQPENQARLARQAELERSGGNQLASLVRSGEGLLKEAMRNPEIAVQELNRWAEQIQTLKEISDNRMPSVADLLTKAAQKSADAAQSKNKTDSSRSVGTNRLANASRGEGQAEPKDQESASPAPSVSDVESSQLDLNAEKSEEPSDSKKSAPSRLTLPNTMLASPPQPKDKQPSLTPNEEIAQAVKEQEDLLAEFDKIADELNQVLSNLEGSTIVKRLKASARRQQQVAAELATLAADAFGVSDRKKEASSSKFQELAAVELSSSQLTSHIMDDMDAYYQRSRTYGFERVLNEMRESDVTAELRLLGNELRSENGLSIAQAEFWSDTFDRWAEDLVEASEGGESPGGKEKGSLPPAVVLEVLKLLEEEVNLREQTRVAEQARPAVSHTEYVEMADQLWHTQDAMQKRADQVAEQIRRLPDAQADFSTEIGLLSKVSAVMVETIEILRRPDTGPHAIAAETEIIELLLESKRFSPSGGGGGAAPGGGGKGDTETPALALVGAGVNANEFREEMSATPETGRVEGGLPEEYREGLDEYFNRLEAWRSVRP